MKYFLYSILDTFDLYIDRIRRSWDYAKFGWSNIDFDSNQLWKIMLFKMVRIYDCLSENKYNQTEPENIKSMLALSRAIILTDCIFQNNYDLNYFNQNGIIFGKKGTNKKIPKDAWEKIKERRDQDIQELADIFKEHSESWWD